MTTAAQKGSDMLLYVDTDGLGSFSQVAGIQNPRITIKKGEADITNQQSTQKFRELLEGAGITSVSISGSGVMTNGAPFSTIRNYALLGTIRNWRCVVPGDATYTGPFQLTQLDKQGQHSKEVTYDFTLENAGVVTAT